MSSPDDWLDSKRLLGANLFSMRPGALLEVAGDEPGLTARIDRWRTHVLDLQSDFWWPPVEPLVRRHEGGAMLVIGAPEDQLFTATEINEAAWRAAATTGRIDEKTRNELARIGADEADPRGMELLRQARDLGIPGFIDDDGVQLGFGRSGKGFDHGDSPIQLDFSGLGGLPVALVTGTNGKTTTSRLLAAMANHAGHVAALTSTDGALVGDRVLEPGDYAGPGGARLVLRAPDATLAVLESARGGLLRRGLAVDHADVAVVTNVGEDHLGDGGINTLEDLAVVKFLVTRVLDPTGVAVLNADDPLCREHGSKLSCKRAWFSLAPPDEASGLKLRAWADDGKLWLARPGKPVEALIDIDRVAISLGGAARYNIANALTAVAAADALGIPVSAIRETLVDFGRIASDNAGRGNLMNVRDFKVLFDFGHNPDGTRAVLETAARLGARRIHVVLGQAGDRTDAAIRGLATAAVNAGAERFIVKEMADYRRGREPGEVPEILIRELQSRGIPADRIVRADGELDASKAALAGADAGDLVVLFIHAHRDEVLAWLNAEADSRSA